MISTLASRLMPLTRMIDPERGHKLAVFALRHGLAGRDSFGDDPAFEISAFGCTFPNPIGLAAGFDKNAAVVQPLMRLGFGFIEAGTVTPRAQAGNPQPRLFRLPEDGAIINRMGMNSVGADKFVKNISEVPKNRFVLGVNISINKDCQNPESEYAFLMEKVAPYSSYVTLNVSSPNTPGLRDLQQSTRLAAILETIRENSERYPPLLVKIAPDLSEKQLASIVSACVEYKVDGMIVSNTTVARPSGLKSAAAYEAGGLSGKPLFTMSTERLRSVAQLASGKLTLIGCGGIYSGQDLLTKIRAGASLTQLYTSFVFEGPQLVARLKMELLAALRKQGFRRVSDAIGVDV